MPGHLVWFGLVGVSFNASLEPQPRARRRARLDCGGPAPIISGSHHDARSATTRQHMHYYTTDLKYETVLARNIQRVNNAVASAAIGLGIAVRARGLARGA